MGREEGREGGGGKEGWGERKGGRLTLEECFFGSGSDGAGSSLGCFLGILSARKYTKLISCDSHVTIILLTHRGLLKG